MSKADVRAYYSEFLEKGKTDPLVFVQKILSPAVWLNPITGKQQELTPNGPQLAWMQNSHKSVNTWSAGNSTGKSFGSALKACWFVNYKIKPGKKWKSYNEYKTAKYKILLTGPESKQAMGLFEQVEGLLMNSPFMSQRVTNITMGTRKDPHPRIELSNGASIHAQSTKGKGKHIEAGDYDVIIFDEPADEPHLDFVIERVLQPRMFRRGGILDLVSTPKGTMNKYFVDQYIAGADEQDDYHDIDVYSPMTHYSQNNSSTENPYADQGTISAFKSTKDDKIVAERIHGKFVSFADAAFPEPVIKKCHDVNMPEMIGASSSRKYITGVDFGRKNDYTVSITLDITELPWTLVHFGRWGGGNVSWEFIFSQLHDIFKAYKSDFLIDATGAGGDMQAEYVRNLGIYSKRFVYTPAKKVLLINNLQDIMARGKVKFGTHKKLIEELRYYPASLEDSKLETDCMMALALACYRAKDYGEGGEPYEY